MTLSGISAANKIYDGNANATLTIGTPGLVGVVSGDNDNLTVGSSPGGVSGSFSDQNVGTGKTVTISGFSLGGDAVGNYVLQPTVTADITAGR